MKIDLTLKVKALPNTDSILFEIRGKSGKEEYRSLRNGFPRLGFATFGALDEGLYDATVTCQDADRKPIGKPAQKQVLAHPREPIRAYVQEEDLEFPP